jgi:hypothetical protein
MLRNYRLAAILTFLLASCPFLWAGLTPTNLDPFAIDAALPNIAVDSEGRIAVVWGADNVSGHYPNSLYHTYSNDGGATFDTSDRHPETGNSGWVKNSYPGLIYDQTGNLNFIWSLTDDSSGPCYTKSDNKGFSWRSRADTALNSGFATYPRDYGVGLAASSDGRTLRTLWYNCPAGSASSVCSGFSSDGGLTWTTTSVVSWTGPALDGQSYMMSAAFAPNGNFYALGIKDNKVNMSRLISGIWSSVDLTSANANLLSVQSNEHTIAFDSNGNIFVVFSMDGKVHYRKSINNGLTWTGTQIHFGTTGTQTKPVIGIDTQGILYIAWQELRSSLNQIRRSNSANGGESWSPSTVVAATTQNQTQPDMIVKGTTHYLVWIENGAPYFVRIAPGDANTDGFVNQSDLNILAMYWGGGPDATVSMGDASGDGYVDPYDLKILSDNYNSLIGSIFLDPNNIFPVPGFDQFGDNHLPTGWLFSSYSPSSCYDNFTQATPGRDGTGSCLEVNSGETLVSFRIVSPAISVSEETTYTLKGHYSATYNKLEILGQWRDNASNILGTFNFVLPATQDRWTAFCDELYSPFGVSTATIEVFADNQSGKIRLDDFSLRKGSLANYASEFSPPALQVGKPVFPIFDWVPPGYYIEFGDNSSKFDREKYHAEFAMANYTVGYFKHRKYGLKEMVPVGNDSYITRRANDPSAWGFLGGDEPSASGFADAAALKAHVKSLAPSKPFYINLLPTYASSAQLGFPTYDQYVETFMSQVNPDYVSFDHYPLLAAGGERGDFYQNFEILRAKALAVGNRNYGSILLSGAVDAYRVPNEYELRWQAYTSLAYGSKIQGWFTYLTYFRSDPNKNSTIDQNGNRTPLYTMLAALNGEIVTLGYTLLNLDSTGVYHSTPLPIGTQSIANSPIIQSISNWQWVVGEFTDNTSRPYIMIVNRSYMESRTATFTLKGSVQNVYEVSKTTGNEVLVPEYNPSTHQVTLTVSPGDGRMFRLE